MSVLDKVMFWKKSEIPDIEIDRFKRAEASLTPDEKMATPLGMPGTEVGSSGWDHDTFTDRTGGSFEEMNPRPQAYQAPHAPSAAEVHPQYAQEITNKSIEVLSSKIDALRAAVESINVRLQNIERIALKSEEEESKRRW